MGSPLTTPPALEDDDVAPRSLLSDAIRRLAKNRMAVAGGLVTAAIAFIAVAADVLVPIDPTYQQTWAGARMPLDRHDVIPDSLVLIEGVATDYPPPQLRTRGASRFVFALAPTQAPPVEVRLLVAKGVIQSIERSGGNEAPVSVAAIDAAAPMRFELPPIDAGGASTPVASARFAVGDVLPAELVPRLGKASRGRATLQLRLAVSSTSSLLEFTIDQDQVVRDIVLDGRPPRLATKDGSAERTGKVVDGRSVTSVLRGGQAVQVTHWLGTDHHGRDLLARVLVGGRISVLIGLVATAVSLLIGVLYGAVAGYVGGHWDNAMMRVVDILYGLPYMFLVIILMVLFGRDILTLFVALGAVQWLTMARIIRGQVLSLKQKEFIEAARAAGAGHAWIIVRHLIPNTLGIISVYTTLTIPAVILQESFLAFIGLAVEWDGQPLESWGSLTKLGMDSLGASGEHWWLLVFPAIALSVALFSLNFLGDGLRDALDPQMKGRS